MVSSSSGIGMRAHLPEDTRMRMKVRRGASCALVAMTLGTVVFTLMGPAVSLFGPDDWSTVYGAASWLLALVGGPLWILGGFGLRAYPVNRNHRELVALPILAVLATSLQRAFFSEVPALRYASVLAVAADVALLLAADRILKDGAGDPTAPRSRIALCALGAELARWCFWFLIVRWLGFSWLGLPLSIACVVLEVLTFVRVRRVLL